MATQEFINGGFIGKMGALVGQHWHNKRYVRAYVIPHDPKTPAQLNHRALFARATRLAQEAFNINKGDSSWYDPDVPEFSRRVGVALRRLKAGASDRDALPLYPDSVPQRLSIQIVYIAWNMVADEVGVVVTAGSDADVATCPVTLYYLDVPARVERSVSGVYRYDRPGRILTDANLFYDSTSTIFSIAGTFRNSSGVDIAGSRLEMPAANTLDHIWYSHAAGVLFITPASCAMRPGNAIMRVYLASGSLSPGAFLGSVSWVIEDTSGNEADDTTFEDNIILQAGTPPYFDLQLGRAVPNAHLWSIDLRLVPSGSDLVGISIFGNGVF